MKKIFNIYAGFAVFILVLMGTNFDIPIINETIPEAMWLIGNCFLYSLGIANKIELSGLHPTNVIFGFLILIYIVICFSIWAERDHPFGEKCLHILKKEWVNYLTVILFVILVVKGFTFFN